MAQPNAKAPLGQGGRFAALTQELMRKKGISKRAASGIAANAGRAKYGGKRMAKMAQAGKADASAVNPDRGQA